MRPKIICTIVDVKDPEQLKMGLNKIFTSVIIDEDDILHQEYMSEHDVFVNEFGYTEDAWNEAVERAKAGNFGSPSEDNIVTFVRFIDSQGNIQIGWRPNF